MIPMRWKRARLQPVSSRTSRRRASSTVSSGSSLPPGKIVPGGRVFDNQHPVAVDHHRSRGHNALMGRHAIGQIASQVEAANGPSVYLLRGSGQRYYERGEVVIHSVPSESKLMPG